VKNGKEVIMFPVRPKYVKYHGPNGVDPEIIFVPLPSALAFFHMNKANLRDIEATHVKLREARGPKIYASER